MSKCWKPSESDLFLIAAQLLHEHFLLGQLLHQVM